MGFGTRTLQRHCNLAASLTFLLHTQRKRDGRQHYAPLRKLIWDNNKVKLIKERLRGKDKLLHSIRVVWKAACQ